MERLRMAALAAMLCLVALGTLHSHAQASERRFTYTYGSSVVHPGGIEFEPWTTFRSGRDGFYNRFDHRFEFELGLTDRLQTAWYFNFSSILMDEGSERVSEFEWSGISWEWKYKLLDPVADPLGMALYLEPGLSTGEAELETKFIVDKHVGSTYGAFNLTLEHEWEYEEQDETEHEMSLEFNLGLAYFLSSSLSAGIEARNHNQFPGGEGLEYSALFVGPVISYATSSWWATLTLMPQLPALKKSESGGSLILDEHERYNARLIFGIDL